MTKAAPYYPCSAFPQPPLTSALSLYDRFTGCVHGMPWGALPLSSSGRRAGPSDALEYVYDLPKDHYPGTFYYHPHYGERKIHLVVAIIRCK